MKTKVCSKCKFDKPLDDFYLKKETKDGRAYQCKSCVKIRVTKYAIINAAKIKKTRLLNYNKNKVKLQEFQRKRRLKFTDDDKIKRSIYHKIYRKKNKTSLLIKDRLYRQSRYNNDLMYKLIKNIRHLVLNSFKTNKMVKNSKTANILGCSFDEFKQHLESKFEPWMNWENRGKYNGELNYGWDIDHIIPVSSAKSEEDIIRLNHYTNLRPLCSKVNRYIKRNN